MKNVSYIFDNFPIGPSFRFVDRIIEVDENKIIAEYRFKGGEFFFKDHFPSNPIVPGSILVEVAAQAGLLVFSMIIAEKEKRDNPNTKYSFYLCKAESKFLNIVRPNDLVRIESHKIYLKENQLKCKVSITCNNKIVYKGILIGRRYSDNHEK